MYRASSSSIWEDKLLSSQQLQRYAALAGRCVIIAAMLMTPGAAATGVVLSALLAALPVAAAADPCGQFSWDVSHERTLFAQPAAALVSGLSAASAPALTAGRLYRLSLHPQPQVQFAAPPGRLKFAEGAHAGMMKLNVEQAGVYRVSLDQPAWVDVLRGSSPLASQDFQAQHDCHAPHKIVEFALPAHEALLLQFSAAAQDSLVVALTRAAPGMARVTHPAGGGQ